MVAPILRFVQKDMRGVFAAVAEPHMTRCFQFIDGQQLGPFALRMLRLPAAKQKHDDEKVDADAVVVLEPFAPSHFEERAKRRARRKRISSAPLLAVDAKRTICSVAVGVSVPLWNCSMISSVPSLLSLHGAQFHSLNLLAARSTARSVSALARRFTRVARWLR